MQRLRDQSGSGEHADNGTMNITESTSDEQVRELVKHLAKETIALHRYVANALQTGSDCTHVDQRVEAKWACDECSAGLSHNYETVLLQNCILGRYLRETIRNGNRVPSFTRGSAGFVSRLLQSRVLEFEKYLSNLARKLHPSSLSYWKRFGSSCPSPITDMNDRRAELSDSLYVFPGRPRCRDGIDFEKVDNQECTKNYFKGTSPTPSFLTVQCSCAHPKLLGFVILKECESISAAISAVLTHFPVPPRRVWYDNACNTFDCAMTRIPWYLRYCMFVVDRFHFSGHNCSNIFNGSRHQQLDGDRSVAAEIINAIIDKGASHISYLDGRNVVPFMKVLFAQLNASARVRDYLGRADLEDEDILSLYRHSLKCTCPTCVRARSNGDDPIDDGAREAVSVFTRSNVMVPVDELHLHSE